MADLAECCCWHAIGCCCQNHGQRRNEARDQNDCQRRRRWPTRNNKKRRGEMCELAAGSWSRTGKCSSGRSFQAQFRHMMMIPRQSLFLLLFSLPKPMSTVCCCCHFSVVRQALRQVLMRSWHFVSAFHRLRMRTEAWRRMRATRIDGCCCSPRSCCWRLCQCQRWS